MKWLWVAVLGLVFGLVLIFSVVLRMWLDHGMHPSEWAREWRQWPQNRLGLVLLIVVILLLSTCLVLTRFTRWT
jgi:hypothetical protein